MTKDPSTLESATLATIEEQTSTMLEAAQAIEDVLIDFTDAGEYTAALGMVEATSRRIYELRKKLMNQAVNAGRRHRTRNDSEEETE